VSIDWFTFAAQLLNFIVLVWLLKRYLYKPILDAVAAREDRISTELANAESIKAEAQQQREAYLHKKTEFEAHRAALLDKATRAAKAEYKRLVVEARQAVDAMRLQQSESLDKSAELLHQAIARRTQREVFAISRKVLSELASVSLDAQMVEKLVKRLYALDEQKRNSFKAALTAGQGQLLLRSAFELSKEQRAAVQDALNEILTEEIEFDCETLPDLVNGIEIVANGQKVAWSIADYLASLETAVDEMIRPVGASHRLQNTDKPSSQSSQ
jgi:F-type H+-transporting ATPase subunit b